MKNNIKHSVQFVALLATASIIFSSCGSKSETKVKPKEEQAHTMTQTQVEISKKQYQTINIQMGAIEQKNLTNTLKATGNLQVPPQNKASITTALGGIVQSIAVQEGDHLRKGQTVCTLVNPDFIKMQEAYLDAQSQLTFAEANFKRQKELAENNVSAQKTFQEATATYHSFQAKVASLKQQLNLLNINTSELTSSNIANAIIVKSPIAGSISHIDINIGTNIDPAKSLMEIVDNNHLHLDLFVFEQDLPKVKIEQTIDFTLTNLPGKSFTAKIYAVGNAFETETKTIPIHAEITNDKTGLIVGMNVTAFINISNNNTSAVLSSAITSFAGNDYIFIQSDMHNDEQDAQQKTTEHEIKDKFQHNKEQTGALFSYKRIQIKKGVTNGGYTEITPLEEIALESKVVINGAFYLMAVLTNSAEED